MNIKPGVVIDGQTYYPEGWMYILAFALKGIPWAIELIEKPECKAAMRQFFVDQNNDKINEKIKYYLEEIEKLKKELL